MPCKKITKYDLVDLVYQNTDYDKQAVQDVIDAFLFQLKESIKEGDTIELRNFGTFEKRLRHGRAEARNPRTGETISVPPHYVSVFRAGKEIKETLWDLAVEPQEK